MPPLPDVTTKVFDGALGIPPASIGQSQVKFGVASLGVANQIYSYARAQDLVASLGTGQLVESGAHTLGVAGGPVYFVAVNASVPGSLGPVFLCGAGAAKTSSAVWSYQPSAGSAATSVVTNVGGGPAMTVTGTNTTGNYGVIVTIITGGIVGTATFTVSLDGGISTSGVITTASTVVLNQPNGVATGLTLAFAVGTYIAGATNSFTSVLHAPVGTGTVVPSGTALASAGSTLANVGTIGAYDVIVTIGTGGALGTATFSYSLDGGLTQNSGTITTTVGGTYAIPGTGITLTFTGTFSAGDKYQFIAVAQIGAGCGSLAVSGANPLDAFQVQVKITASGATLAANTGAFQISLDGGRTFGPVLAIPTGGTYLIPSTGLTLTFGNGQGTGTAFVAGDVYVFDVAGPGYTLTDLTNAWNAWLADPRSAQASVAHVVGTPATAAAAATLAATVENLAAAAETNSFKPYAFILDGPDDTDANLGTSFASAVDPHVCMPVGFVALTSSTSGGRVAKRPLAWSIASRVAKKPLAEDVGRVRSGSLEGVQALYRDEYLSPGLDAQRFATARTFPGLAGFYAVNGNMLAAAGSDFNWIQRRQVINAAIVIGRAALLTFVGDTIRVNPTTGFIDERDARIIENYVASQVNAALFAPGYLSGAANVQVNRGDNLLQSSTVKCKVLLTPLGVAKFLELDLGFFNPALVQKSS